MGWIKEDNLQRSVRRIFTNPVRLQDPPGPRAAPSWLLGGRGEASSEPELVDAMVDRRAAGDATVDRRAAGDAMVDTRAAGGRHT